MLKDIIAKRYAKAALQLAEKSGETEVVKGDLNAMAEAYKTSKGLQNVVMNPSFSARDKSKVLKGLAGQMKLAPMSARLVDTLVEKGRFRYIREVAGAYSDLLDAAQGRVKATVTSAQPLSEAEVAKLNSRLKSVMGKDVELKVEVDPSLIGGVRTRIGSTVYDGSINHQIRLVREALLNP